MRRGLVEAWLVIVSACLSTLGCSGDGDDGNATAAAGSGGASAGGTGGSSGGTGGSSGGTGGSSGGSGAPDCDGLITDKQPHPMTSLAKPGRSAAAIDPEFGTRILRVTDAASETGGSVIKPMYSTIPAWNADESYLILYEAGGSHRLYDGRNYEFVRELSINPADLEQVYWHPLDPDLLFYVDGNDLTQYSVSQNATTVLHTFSGCSSVSAGSDPMYISWDGNSFGLFCENTNRAFVYHLDTNVETQSVAPADLGAQVAPSGNYVYLEGDVYDGDMNLLRSLDLNNPYDHASLGQLENGRDTLNIVAFDPGQGGSGVGTLVVFDMTTGQDTVVVGETTGYPYPPSGTHISAVAHRAPGWVAISVVGDVDGQDVLDNELLLVDTNTNEVCRVAHHRSHGNNGPQGYWAEPHAAISPSATRIIFGSDWGGGETVDTYVVELPSSW